MSVSFDLAEWLRALDRKLDAIVERLEAKADRRSVEDMERRLLMIETVEKARRDIRIEEQGRMARLESAVNKLISAETTRDTAREFRRWAVPAIAAMTMAGVTIAQVVH